MSGQLSKISRTNLEKAFLRFVENSPDDKKLFEMNSRAKTFLSFHNNIEEIRFIEDLDGERKEELEGHICIECHGDLTAKVNSKKGIAKHFAHKPGAKCSDGGGVNQNIPETLLHFMGKRAVAELGALSLPGPIRASSEEFPDITEIAFADSIITYHSVDFEERSEKSTEKYLPDVRANMDEPFGDHTLLVEIHVTNSVSDEKKRQVGQEGDNLDMIEIDLDDLHRRGVVKGKNPVTKKLVADHVYYKGRRDWKHKRVERVLQNRVKLREIERRIENDSECLRIISNRLTVMRASYPIYYVKNNVQDLIGLAKWVKAESDDYENLSRRLEDVLRESMKEISLDGPIRSISDLDGNTFFKQATGLVEEFRNIHNEHKRLKEYIPKIEESIQHAKESLGNASASDDESVNEAEVIQLEMGDMIKEADSIIYRLKMSADVIYENQENISQAMTYANDGARVLRDSISEKIDAIEAEKKKQPDRQARETHRAEEAYIESNSESDRKKPRSRLGDHPELGRALGKRESEHVKNRFLGMISEVLPYNGLNRILEAKVSFLDNMPLYKALCYERSPEILPQLCEEVSYLLESPSTIEAGPDPDPDPDPT